MYLVPVAVTESTKSKKGERLVIKSKVLSQNMLKFFREDLKINGSYNCSR
jgi:hypothetical protein